MERCPSCESLFHKPCFAKLTKCHCGVSLRVDETRRLSRKVGHRLGTDEENGAVYSFLGKSTSISPLRSLSGLFAKSNQTTKEHKDSENIILMGSLPTGSLWLSTYLCVSVHFFDNSKAHLSICWIYVKIINMFAN